jgi:hypothetical protein
MVILQDGDGNRVVIFHLQESSLVAGGDVFHLQERHITGYPESGVAVSAILAAWRAKVQLNEKKRSEGMRIREKSFCWSDSHPWPGAKAEAGFVAM